MANRIRQLRLERVQVAPRAFTISELARRLGVSESTLRRWEEGQVRPRRRHARALARELGVTVDQLQLPEAGAASPAVVRPMVAAAIIVEDGRVLLVRRRFREGNFSWGYPTGQVEPGETPEQTATREVREEVGLEVEPERRLGERIHPATGRRMVYMVCRIVGGGRAELIDHEELAELAWCTLSELDERTRGLPGGIFGPVLEYLTGVVTPGATDDPGRSKGASRAAEHADRTSGAVE